MALVTGANPGIGLGDARRLAKRGDTVEDVSP
jgi:NAD(P)-dependent dehydrogenase (short-subunit alcohol dehydrogenase family)